MPLRAGIMSSFFNTLYQRQLSNSTNNNTTSPSPGSLIPANQVGYQWVGFIGVLENILLVIISLWRICVHHTSYRPYLSCSSKRLFHWLIFIGRISLLPVYIGILVYGEFNLVEYTLHTLNNVFQSAALAIVIKEWAYVIAVLRQHSGGRGGGVSGVRRFKNGSDGGGKYDPLLRGRSDSNGKGTYDSSGSSVYESDRHTSWTAPLGGGGEGVKNSSTGNTGWTGLQQVTFVRTVAIVYVAVFAVLCLAAFIACASGPYDLMNPIDTGTFFRTSTHIVYISLETVWEAAIGVVFLIYGISLRKSLIENSPPRSQGRVRKTLCRINMVVAVSAMCSLLRLGLHVRSLFGRNARTNPHWISELLYYILYDFIGRGLPVVILLILMRNPDKDVNSRMSNSEKNNHKNMGGGSIGGDNNRNNRNGRSPMSDNSSRYGEQDQGVWSSGDDQGQYSDWPSESSRSPYGTLSEGGSHSHNQSMTSDLVEDGEHQAKSMEEEPPQF